MTALKALVFVVGAALLGTTAAQSQVDYDEVIYDQMVEQISTKNQDLIDIRHDIHRHPELSGSEKRTSRLIANYLDELGFTVRSGVGGYGVVGILEGGHPGPTVAFRADMDAVRSSDYDPVEFRSSTPGIRHICGHDIHTTIGLGIAEGFATVSDDLPGTVMLLFQPAEERGTGAKSMLEDGVFDHYLPDALFAVHTAPYQVGEIATRPGGLMAGRALVSVTVSGTGDIAAATDIVRTAIQESGNVAPQAAYQVAPEGFILVQLFPTSGLSSSGSLTIRGQIMTAGYEDRSSAKNKILSAVESLNLSGIDMDVTYDDGFMEGVNNDAGLVEVANAAIETLARDVTIREARGASPVFSEDFGSFQLHVPGVMYFLGVSNSSAGTVGMPHSPDYVADDASIDIGTRVMLAAMLGRMTGE
ncbi:MAG: amidohydrolase [Rhodothermales bacterium]|nr:amidohydrolase [Rhodothermales bacterium]